MTLSLEKVDVLAVGAHPDDVELGCGGTLLALGTRGRRVGILDLTRGEMGTRGTPERRASEAAAAARLLGARFRHTLDLGDGGLRVDRDAELAVVAVVRACQPRLVLAPLPRDRLKGLRIVRQDMRAPVDFFRKIVTPEGRNAYWPGWRHLEPAGEGTDIWAVRNGFVSVSVFGFDQSAAAPPDASLGLRRLERLLSPRD